MSDQPTDQPTERPTDQPTDSPTLESTDVAAVRLGISRNAVLQRIKRGTLAGQKVDGVWWVIVDDRFNDHVTDRPTDCTTEQPTDRLYNRPTDQRISSSAAARSQLEAIRDEWLAPLVAQITDQAETIGQLRTELDHTRQSAEVAIAKHDQVAAERDELLAVREDLRIRLAELEAARRSSQDTLALTAIEASSAPETATEAATDTPRKQRQRRWWLRLFGVDE